VTRLPGPRIYEQFDEDGRLVDDELRSRIHTTLAPLAPPVTATSEPAKLAAS